jgi:hypothetical protein
MKKDYSAREILSVVLYLAAVVTVALAVIVNNDNRTGIFHLAEFALVAWVLVSGARVFSNR